MKKNIIISFLILLTACIQKQALDVIPTTSSSEKSIDSLLNHWHNSATEADFESYFNFMDSISVFIGTDASENWTKEQFAAFSKPYFDKGKAWSFEAFERNIYFSQDGSVAWFDELLDTWMGTCRGSGVLERTGNDWKLKHYVLSVAIPNESVQDVIEVKSHLDSLFRSNISDN